MSTVRGEDQCFTVLDNAKSNLEVLQLALASVLVFVADGIGLRNPLGVMLAVIVAVSLGGAAVFGLWRLVVR